MARRAVAVPEGTRPLAGVHECLNCGEDVERAYCPECGQARIEPDPTLREFVHEAAEELLHWDGKLGLTYRTLVARPGQLTREYLAGRRARYISPLRVYLTCSVLFFFLSATIPEPVRFDGHGRRVRNSVVNVGKSTPEDLTKLEALAQRKPLPQRTWMQHLARGLATPDKLTNAVLGAIPQTMFVLVPFFAALLGVVMRDRRRRYPQHLAFALHEHAVFFLGLSLATATRFVSSTAVALGVQPVIGIAIAVHLVMAARRVYEQSLMSTVLRLAMVVPLYFAGFIAMMFVTFALIVLEF